MIDFDKRLADLNSAHETLLDLKNEPISEYNGVYQRYKNPVLTAAHAPVHWRYDLNPETNPFLMERIGINGTFNATRYHSLTIRPGTLPDEMSETAHSGDGVIMGVRDEAGGLEGVQFHPESILTPEGNRLLRNFLHTPGPGGSA